MFNSEVINEIHGTITEIYSYPVYDAEEKKTYNAFGITIKADGPDQQEILESYNDIDYSVFSVGQRVVHVTYKIIRPPYDYEIEENTHMGEICPDLIEDICHVTYDERLYGPSRIKRR